MKYAIRWIKNFKSAIWAWISIWFIEREVLERRVRFMEDVICDEDKCSIPVKIWNAAYKKRLIPKHKNQIQ